MISEIRRQNHQHHSKTVIERITEAILVLKEKFGLDDDGKTLSVTLTRREIET